MSRFQSRRETTTATIAINQTTSGAVSLGGGTLVGIQMPAAFTGTSIGLMVTLDGTNYVDVYDLSGNLLAITVAADRYISLDPGVYIGLETIKIKSGSTELAARTITLVVKPV